MLLIISRDIVPDDVLRLTFERVASVLCDIGYQIIIKDHPRPEARLNILEERANILDPEIPIEALDWDSFDILIGLASTALSILPQKINPISIIKLLPEEYQNELQQRLNHLWSIGCTPFLPRDTLELVEILKI